jgi:four helix bundle protein
MTYTRFEDIPAWQASIEAARLVFLMTSDRAFAGQGDLANQLQRATLSISNNIAEGFERGTTPDLITFLYYSRGSAGEVRSMLCLMEKLDRFTHLKSQISNLKSLIENISRQIRGWADHLQNTEIRGQRHLNKQSRSTFEKFKRADSFLSKLKSIRESDPNGKTET